MFGWFKRPEINIHITTLEPSDVGIVKPRKETHAEYAERLEAERFGRSKAEQARIRQVLKEHYNQLTAEQLSAWDTIRQVREAWEQRLEEAVKTADRPPNPYRVIPVPSGAYQVEAWSFALPSFERRFCADDDGYFFYSEIAYKISQLERSIKLVNNRIERVEADNPAPEVVWAAFGVANPHHSFAQAQAWVRAWMTNQDVVEYAANGAAVYSTTLPEPAPQEAIS